MGKPHCIHFQFQIHMTCVFHLHVATDLKKQQFVLSIMLHNKQDFQKKKQKKTFNSGLIGVVLG